MITSPQNAQIKAARKLTNRKERYAAGQLLVEGVRLIDDAWQSGARPVTVFYAPELIDANPAAAQLGAAHGRLLAAPACLVRPAVFATLTETVTPQGVAAVFPLPNLPLPAHSTLALVLDAVRDPGNAGTLLRSAEAAGVDCVLFGPETVDPFNDKVLRAGMGAHFRLPLRVCPTWEQVMPLLGAGKTLYLATAAAELAYDTVDWRQPAVLVVGGEAAGASSTARQLATPLAIPMCGQVESLNAAVAGAVILFEAARQRRLKDRL